MAHVDSNVVYGMYSGLALLMDVHYPDEPNGLGIVFIAGSGWHAPMGYDALPLKESPQVAMYRDPLVEAGYTVFALNHRAAPAFRYPAAVEDVQRAVRFIRHHAKEFAINPDSIGAWGGSSGAYMVSMLGVLGSDGDPDDDDPVGRESASVQCVVARAAPSDFVRHHSDSVGSFMGTTLGGVSQTSVERRLYAEASPLTHVSADAPPFLLMHGDADPVVPFEQSEVMEAALRQAGVEVKLIRVAGGGHGPAFDGATNLPDVVGEVLSWFATHLRQTVPTA
jgi:acetyl esterase/lipase